MKITFNKSISEIKKKDWDSLIPQSEYPFLKYDFLDLLESSDSVGRDSGWVPMHLTLEDKGKIIAAVPLYLKNHYQGEFVFHHA